LTEAVLAKSCSYDGCIIAKRWQSVWGGQSNQNNDTFSRKAFFDAGRKRKAMSAPQNEHVYQCETDRLRQIEHERLRALIEVNIAVANRLHADDFQLITPSGSTLSKEEYLGRVASGEINYLVWEPGVIEVRLQEQMAVIRYQSELELGVPGEVLLPNTTHRGHYWHLDVYEKHQGIWQVVWSQATEIQAHENE
jgi:hypothetical protein